MHKKIIVTIIILSLLVLVFLPYCGVPSKKEMDVIRANQLHDWHKAVSNYIDQKREVPENLYQVFKYNMDGQKVSGLSFLIVRNGEKEHQYVVEEKILEYKDKFVNLCEYSLIFNDSKWQICEKKIYPFFFKRLMGIDEDGMLSELKNP